MQLLDYGHDLATAQKNMRIQTFTIQVSWPPRYPLDLIVLRLVTSLVVEPRRGLYPVAVLLQAGRSLHKL